MSDENKQRIKLSISPKATLATSASDGEESNATAILKPKKRVIKLDKPEKKTPQPKQAAKKQKPKKAPSILRMNNLDTELGKWSKIWRSHTPLALGIEKQIFKAIADGHLSASKNIVRSLLHKHCNNKNYLVDVADGATRFNLDGSEAGQCDLASEEHARRVLKKLEIEKLTKKTLKQKRK